MDEGMLRGKTEEEIKLFLGPEGGMSGLSLAEVILGKKPSLLPNHPGNKTIH